METNVDERLTEIEKKLDEILRKIVDVYDTVLAKEIKYNTDITDYYGASKILGISVSTLKNYVAQRKIPFIRRKNKTYFSRRALIDWLGDWEYIEDKKKREKEKKIKELKEKEREMKEKEAKKYWD